MVNQDFGRYPLTARENVAFRDLTATASTWTSRAGARGRPGRGAGLHPRPAARLGHHLRAGLPRRHRPVRRTVAADRTGPGAVRGRARARGCWCWTSRPPSSTSAPRPPSTPVPGAHRRADHRGHLAPVRHRPARRPDRRARRGPDHRTGQPRGAGRGRAAATPGCSPPRRPGSPAGRERPGGARTGGEGGGGAIAPARPRGRCRLRRQLRRLDLLFGTAWRAAPLLATECVAGRARLVVAHAGLPARLPRSSWTGRRRTTAARIVTGLVITAVAVPGGWVLQLIGGGAQRPDDRPGQPAARHADRHPDVPRAVPRAFRAARLPGRDRHPAGAPPHAGRRARPDPGAGPVGRSSSSARPCCSPWSGRRWSWCRCSPWRPPWPTGRRPGCTKRSDDDLADGQAAARRPVLGRLDRRASAGAAHLRGDRGAAGPSRPARRTEVNARALRAPTPRRWWEAAGWVRVRGRLRRRDRGPGAAGRARRTPRPGRGRGGQPAAPGPAPGDRGHHQRRLVRGRVRHRATGCSGWRTTRRRSAAVGRPPVPEAAGRRHPAGPRRLHLPRPGDPRPAATSACAARRSTVAVVGENGAGKTTLVKLLTGMYRSTEGRITVDGQDLADINPDRWREATTGGVPGLRPVRHVTGRGRRRRRPAPHRRPARRYPAQSAGPGRPTSRTRGWAAGSTRARPPTGRPGAVRRAVAAAGAGPRADARASAAHRPGRANRQPRRRPSETALFGRYGEAARGGRGRGGAITVLVSHRFCTVHMADRSS